jgi:S-DNA-T family DNA segregation ATPase FtsK/SpoIIIE
MCLVKPSHSVIRRPWLDPLPTYMTPTSLMVEVCPHPDNAAYIPHVRIPLGLIDRPETQSREFFVFDREVFRHMLVIGGRHMGKTNVLNVIADGLQGGDIFRLSRIPERFWQQLEKLCDVSELSLCAPAARDEPGVNGQGRRVVVIDDLDSVMAGLEPEYRQVAVDNLATLLRGGTPRSPLVVAAVQRVAGGISSLVGLFDDVIVMAMASKQEYLAAGGEGSLYSAQLPPGRFQWQGSIGQFVIADACGTDHEVVAVPRVIFDRGGVFLVVAARVAVTVTRLKTQDVHIVEVSPVASPGITVPEVSVHNTATVFVADVDTWMSQWSLLMSIRAVGVLIFDGCTPTDFRGITRRRTLPPPLRRHEGEIWVHTLDGEVSVRRWGAGAQHRR